MGRPPVAVRSRCLRGQRPVVDDVLHDEDGRQTLDARQRSQPLVVELLEGGQVDELLGTLHMVACATVYLAVGLLARTVLKARPSAARTVTRASGAMMIAIGGFLLVEHVAG